jgi:glutathione S-transferase
MLTLYGEPLCDSPFVFTTFVALMEKGVKFELRLVDLERGEQRTDAFVARSLTGRVPTIADGDFSLSESLAIVEYLEETLPPPKPRLYPADLHARARARQLLGWLRSHLAALRQERPSSSIFFESARAPLSERAASDAALLARIGMTLLEGQKAFLFGDFSIADADLAFAVMRLVKNGDPVLPRLRDHAEAVWARPSVSRWVSIERPVKPPVLGPF